ncbi:MAG: UvrD-helicase domain-containing protein, partial [Clostridiales bacterium]|nr:UvrD-helicase domain-containing protein [Clostridiales bacterium]
TEGAVLVLAGAGSGKTRVLTYRIAHLVKDLGVHPYTILALTFTNKAAREMRERTADLINRNVDDMWVMTFHAFCARILRYDGDAIGIGRNFTIYDDADKKRVIAEAMKRLDIDTKALDKNIAAKVISDAKNKFLNPEEALVEASEQLPRIDEIYIEYERAMKNANALDFDDLILKTVMLFQTAPHILEKYENLFRYILVDEYQDTNITQYELIQLLRTNNKNIFVVGDDDQSIYSWRGATIRNILEFEKDFPDAKTIRLEQNYRSTNTILKAANSVIMNNCDRKGKNLWTNLGEGDSIIHYYASNDYDEADFIAKTILRNVRDGAKLREHAILYRTNAQSRIIESTLTSYSIPYNIYGGFKFLERAEVKDIIAYLRIIVNPTDTAAFYRIVNVPTRGIGEKTIELLDDLANSYDVSPLSALLDEDIFDELPNTAQKKFTPFISLYKNLKILRENEPVAFQFAKKLINVTEYDDYLKTFGDEAEGKKENLYELLNAIAEFEENAGEEDALPLFLENMALVSDADSADSNQDRVSLMTMHTAKGLEFFCVFIAGMDEELFPSFRSIEDASRLEEERRLCYVGITRARKKLFLISAASRRLYNQFKSYKQSRFVEEIPDFLKVCEGMTPPKISYQNYSGYGSYASGGFGQRNINRNVSKPPVIELPKVESNYQEGMRIKHEKFGIGTIEAVSGTGGG